VAKRTQTPFGDYLDTLLRARGLSVRRFAAQVGRDSGAVCNIKRLTLNPKLMEPWADVLGLTDQERELFIKLAWLAHAPPYVQELVARLEARATPSSPRQRRHRK
jgi:hypothetical protein